MKTERETSEPRRGMVERLALATNWVVRHQDTATRIYLLLLFTAMVAYLARTPIGSGDTDLWFHMNGGKQLWVFDELPASAFYSIFGGEDDRSWANYYWGFQALVYQLHEALGYPGLILLRVAIVGMTFASIVGLLVRSSDLPAQRAWSLAVLAIVILVLVGRTELIRPHLVSYLMIPLFLLILSHRRRWLPALPGLTIVWVNLHGIEWPIGALICGGHAMAALYQYYRGNSEDRVEARRTLTWTLACAPALFVNPFGAAILGTPFHTSGEVYLYVGELQPLTLTSLFTVIATGPIIGIASARAMLIWGTVIALLVLLLRGRVRWLPVLFAAAGLYLLSKGMRFAWEWMLLSLPLWRLAIDQVGYQDARKPDPGTDLGTAVLGLVLAAPFATWAYQVDTSNRWPVDTTKLPIGVSEFIDRQGIRGSLVAPVNSGGYLAWRHYPDLLVSADMQAPPSTPWDHYQVLASMRNAPALSRVIARYAPELFAVDVTSKGFRELIASHPDFRPVFFDDQLVLYANSGALPEVVERHALRHVNPFNLLDGKLGTVEERLSELRAIAAVHPDGGRVQHAITQLLFNTGDYEAALASARRFSASVPNDVNSHYLLGNSLENLDRYEEAERAYHQALDVSTSAFKPVIYRHLGAIAYLRRDFAAAYGYFSKGTDPYRQTTAPEYLYQYALASAAIGHEEKAELLLQQLLFALPADETRMRERAEKLMGSLYLSGS